MKGQAFCPAHITGFFKAETGDERSPEYMGSVGAGFSIKDGVTTTVQVSQRQDVGYRISTDGFDVKDTRVSKSVVEQFLALGEFEGYFLDITHVITVPVGYGLGCSGAVALSLAYALDRALETGLADTEIGRIAHVAEISCKTGLGDVLASYHGGFEIRTAAGAPGIGRVEKIKSDSLSVIMICFAPISTTDFLRDHLSEINGLGGKMVDRLRTTRRWDQFEDMSLEFARYVKIITPRMQAVVDELKSNGIKCGVALFGQTVFALTHNDTQKILDIVSRYKDAVIINSEIDQLGARIIQ